MFKIMFGLTRKDGMSLEDFKRFWLKDHAPKVARLPDLRRYTIDVKTNPDQPGVDGYATLWYDTEADFLSSFGSEYGRTIVVPNNANFNQPDKIARLPVDEFEIPVG